MTLPDGCFWQSERMAGKTSDMMTLRGSSDGQEVPFATVSCLFDSSFRSLLLQYLLNQFLRR
jgi:hypothetical protein